MTIAVDMGRKATKTNKQTRMELLHTQYSALHSSEVDSRTEPKLRRKILLTVDGQAYDGHPITTM